jgi:5-formyltetrahydrofolate cyclo-ligase
MSERRAGLPAVERRARAEVATERLLALPELAELAGRTIAAYVAVKGELDPAAALERARARGCRVALPRVSREPPRLRFHEVAAGDALAPMAMSMSGPFGLLEPAPGSPEVAVEDLDLVIVPGLAFDGEGRRLGFGGGYYDGALASVRARAAGGPALIGLAYDFQIVDVCPAGDGDLPVDLVVTDARVLRPAVRLGPGGTGAP